MKDINGAQATTGFPVLFLYTSIYSVIALLLIGISCCFPHNWNLEFFLCVFNLICVGEIIYFIHRVINRREKRMTIESFHCAIAIISAMLGAGVILGINIFCVSRGFVIPVVPWLCICVESFFVIIPSLALIVTIGYIFIEDIYFKCRIRRLYKVYQSNQWYITKNWILTSYICNYRNRYINNNMRPERRASFACICAMLVNKTTHYSSVYDYGRGQYVNCSVSGTIDNFSLYDYSRSCYVSYTPNSAYDYGSASYVYIQISGHTLSLYDYYTGSYCSVTVNGNSVSFYDYQNGQYFNFSVN